MFLIIFDENLASELKYAKCKVTLDFYNSVRKKKKNVKIGMLPTC